MTAVKGSLVIPAGSYQSTGYFNKEGFALGLAIRIPLGFQGILAVRVADDPDETPAPIYDDVRTLIQVDPTGIDLPAWFVLKADLMPVHFLWVESYTDTTETSTQNQDVARTLRVMGTS